MPLQLSNRPLGRFVRNLIVMGLICQACTGVVSAADAVQHSMFAGSLIQPGDDDGDILRRFEVQLLTTNQTCFFHVIDDARLDVPGPTVSVAQVRQRERTLFSHIWSMTTMAMHI